MSRCMQTSAHVTCLLPWSWVRHLVATPSKNAATHLARLTRFLSLSRRWTVGKVVRQDTLKGSVSSRSASNKMLLPLALSHDQGMAHLIVNVLMFAHRNLATLRDITRANESTTLSPIQKIIPLMPLATLLQKTEEGVLAKLHTLQNEQKI